MPFLFILAFPFLEIYLLAKVAEVFGFMNLVFFLVLKAFVGMTLSRYFRQRGAQINLDPDQLFFKSAAQSLGSFLLMLPALILSGVGVLILFRPTRFLLGKFFGKLVGQGLRSGRFGGISFQQFGGTSFQGGFTSANMHPKTSHFSDESMRDVSPHIIDVRPTESSTTTQND